ncbi:MAG: M20/M25/M40 family metallo-hydrolase [Verrucomicrobiota bacterium]
MDIPSLRQSAETLLPEMLDWLRRMVETNSFTTNPEGVNQLGALTAECFAELGFRSEAVPSDDPTHGSHLFLRRGPSDKKPIVLVTHLDTVFPPEEEVQNDFRWQPEGNRIYGPGTVDIKGGTTLIWLMLKLLREASPELYENTHWIIAANSAEEVIGADFARKTTERCPQGAHAVLVFEGGPHEKDGWHLVTARKGRAEYRITSHGRAAHAGSNHTLGINAVVELARILPAVSALTNPEKKLTLNLASMHGGTVLNRVPHEAVADLEMRAFEPATLAEAGEALESFTQRTAAGAEINVECIGRTQAWPGGLDTDALFHAWEKAATEMGISAVAEQRGGLSDANYLCLLGPTIDGLGPSGGNAHCSERSADGSKLPEYVEKDSFVTKAVLNVLAVNIIAAQQV